MSPGAARGLVGLLALAAGACQAEVSAGRVDRCALGVHVDPQGDDTFAEAVAGFETLIGRTVDLDRQYYRIDQDVPGERERATAALGRTPMISVTGELTSGEVVSWARIADPADAEADALVRGLARRLAAFDARILVIFHDEAQGDADVFGTPEEFVAAWRRVVDVARAEGAVEVEWVWALSAGAYPSEADRWYPGDEWVTWIGASGFNWYTGDPVSPWRTFPSIYTSFHDWARPHGKPQIVVSVSTAEHPGEAPDAPRSKATWIAEAAATLEAWPEVEAFVWYQSPGLDATRDWRVDSTPAALTAFRTLAADAHFDVTGVRLDP